MVTLGSKDPVLGACGVSALLPLAMREGVVIEDLVELRRLARSVYRAAERLEAAIVLERRAATTQELLRKRLEELVERAGQVLEDLGE